MSSMSDRERTIRRKLRDDFSHYASRCLRIRTKAGKIEPLVLNQAQLYLHGRLEAQRQRTGKVRALVLKGRQQGISTYIGGRYYWRASHSKGVRVFILTHEQDATNNLFGMVERYHSHCPDLVKPVTGAANAKELSFEGLESGYAVGTAGAKADGRSQTVQLFHGSEVAFWPNAKTHFAGVVQAIPDLPGTEIVLESTANGVGGEFHERWQQAEAGTGDYEAIFIPWFWEPDTAARCALPGFKLDEEEQAYATLTGSSLEQMVWRRAKIAELKDPLLFKQEYPATAEEAFQLTGHDSFIKSERFLQLASELRGHRTPGDWCRSGPVRRRSASRMAWREAGRSARSRAAARSIRSPAPTGSSRLSTLIARLGCLWTLAVLVLALSIFSFVGWRLS
jgi:hypothetical protein